MKLNFFQLETHLAKQLAPVYIASGDELILKRDVLERVRLAAICAGFNDYVKLSAESGMDWDQLYTLLHATSLFAEKQCIEIDFRDATPHKTAANILLDYAKQPSPHHLLLINISKIDDKIAKSEWYKALDKVGISIPVWPIPREQFPQWLILRAKQLKLTLMPDAANLLADYLEGNLVAAVNTIEKMDLLRPQGTINRDTVKALLTDESQFNIFDFVDHFIAGPTSRTRHTLAQLQAEGVEPTLILWGIARELRLMAELATQIKQGVPYDQLFQKHRIFARRQASVRAFLNRHSASNCWQALTQTAEIDRMIKGALPGNPWDAIEKLCVGI